MKLRRLVFPFVAALPLLLALVAACDGGAAGMTLEDYFRALEEISQQSEEESDALREQFPAADQDPDQARNFFEETIRIFIATMDEVGALEPPDEVQDAHDRFVEAGDVIREQIGPQIIDLLAEVQTAEELQQAFVELDADADLNAAVTEFEQACLALEDLAGDNDIEVELTCTD